VSHIEKTRRHKNIDFVFRTQKGICIIMSSSYSYKQA
jgi:hypothetical protein